MERVTLFSLETADIRISMQLYFNEERQLIFDGYDSGKTAERAFGDSDYEYTYTIESGEVDKMYKVFNLETNDRSGLLTALKEQFGVNEAYSLFGEFLTENAISFSAFSWA
jgi:hypothetical protein